MSSPEFLGHGPKLLRYVGQGVFHSSIFSLIAVFFFPCKIRASISQFPFYLLCSRTLLVSSPHFLPPSPLRCFARRASTGAPSLDGRLPRARERGARWSQRWKLARQGAPHSRPRQALFCLSPTAACFVFFFALFLFADKLKRGKLDQIVFFVFVLFVDILLDPVVCTWCTHG